MVVRRLIGGVNYRERIEQFYWDNIDIVEYLKKVGDEEFAEFMAIYARADISPGLRDVTNYRIIEYLNTENKLSDYRIEQIKLHCPELFSNYKINTPIYGLPVKV